MQTSTRTSPTGLISPNDASSSPSAVQVRREWRAVLLLLLAAIVLWWPYWWHSRSVALANNDAQDYAQVARHLVAGDGFQTSCLPLNALEWMRQTGRLGQTTWWDVHRFPFPSVIIAGFIKLLGPKDLAVSLWSAIFFWASIPLVFVFARRMFPYKVALMATFLFAFANQQFEDSMLGLTEPAAIFLFLSTLYLVLWKPRLRMLAVAGLLTGVAFLNRTTVILYLLPLLYLVWKALPGRRGAALATFLVPFFLVIAPWMVRNYQLTGDPNFSLTSAIMARVGTDVNPKTNDWYQFHYEKMTDFWRQHPTSMAKKYVKQMYLIWKDEARIGEMGLLLPFVILALLKRYEGEADRVRKWLYVVFAIHFLVLGLMVNNHRYYALFSPFLAMFAADVLAQIWETLKPRPTRFGAVVVAVLVIPLVFWRMARIISYQADDPADALLIVESNPNNQKWLAVHTPKDAIILCDMPWSVSWYAYRRSLPIPPTPADLPKFADYRIQPYGIYLRRPRSLATTPDEWETWRKVQEKRLPVAGYRLAHAFPDGALFYQRIP